MTNIEMLEKSLTDLFDDASSWSDGIVAPEVEIEPADVREIRTDIVSLLGSRPSGN